MPFSTYRVVSAFKDPSKLNIFNEQVDANRNIIAILEFPNDDPSGDNVKYYANGNDLTDTRIEAQARDILKTLNEQETSLAKITINSTKVPAPPDQKLLDLLAAQKTFQTKSFEAMIKSRNDPGELQAYADLLTAQEAAREL